MSNPHYRQTEEQLAQLRRRNIAEKEERVKQLYDTYPQLLQLDQSLRDNISAFNKAKLKSEASEMKAISSKIEALKAEIQSFKIENKLDESLFQIQYHCNLCKDTGMIEKDGVHQKCACFKQMLLDAAYKDGANESIKTQTFECFNCNLFSDALMDGAGNSVRSNMQKIASYCEKYADAFPLNQRKNIIFTGKTGVGKTFLLNCIAARLLQNGYNILSITAGRLFEVLRSYAFGQVNNIDHLLYVDLLLIDDFGTEPMFNNTTIEFLFLLINERTKIGKHMVITTNLTAEQLEARYTQRITSRIFDQSASIILNVLGEDLRLKKQ